jgi:hypothetical protein
VKFLPALTSNLSFVQVSRPSDLRKTFRVMVNTKTWALLLVEWVIFRRAGLAARAAVWAKNI